MPGPRALVLACGIALAILAAWHLYTRYFETRRTGVELNISCFVYRDVNRNGIYDLGDRPYAGLAIRMAPPGGTPVAAASNVAGFANFTMSSRRSTAAVNVPGRYSIAATAPPGWKITSDNAVQSVSFRALDTAPAGIVAEALFVPIGVAPELTVSGMVGDDAPAGQSARGALVAVSPQGDRTDVEVTDAGRFSFAVEPGDWQLVHTTHGGRIVARRVRVDSYAVVLSRIMTDAPDAAHASGGPLMPPKRRTHTVDFDSLTSSDTLHELPNGYAGLNWTNWVATHQKLYGAPGYLNGAVSSEFVAYNSSGHPATIWSERAFDLAGVYLSVAWPPAEKHDVLVKAWRGDRLAHEERLRLRTAGPVHFDADFRNVTRIEFSSDAYWQLVIDDLEYRTD